MTMAVFASGQFAPVVAQEVPPVDFKPAAELSGIALAKDGDDIVFGKVAVRLRGIAAPEYRKRKREPGGLESMNNLSALINGRELRCYLDGTAAQNRPVAVCFLGKIDIGQYQVETGHARDCPRYSNQAYSAAEANARKLYRDLSANYDLPEYCD